MNKKIIQMCTFKRMIPLLCLLTSLVFSSATHAVTLNISAIPTGVSWDFENGGGVCQQWDATNSNAPFVTQQTVGSGWCFAQSDTVSYSAIATNSFKPVQEGYYYVLTFYTLSWGTVETVTWNIANYTDNFALIDYQLKWQGNSQQYCDKWGTLRGLNTVEYSEMFSCDTWREYDFSVRQWQVILQAKHTGNYTIGIGRFNERNELLRTYSRNKYRPGVRLASIEEYVTLSDLDRAEKETQEASEEGQTNSEGSQTDNEGASQNVIGVIGNVIGAFSTPAGDCSYNVDLGNLDLGDLNFCSGKPPEFAGLINMAGSIIIVYACYRVARTVFRIWLAMSVFAQGGGKGKTD